MTYEELIAGMDKWEAVFRCLTQLRSGCDLSCLKCPYWNEDDGGHWYCTQPSIEKICRADFKEWMRKEIE